MLTIQIRKESHGPQNIAEESIESMYSTLYTAATRMASEQHLLYKISFQVIIISRFAYSVRFSIISYSVQILMNQANKINNKQYFLYMIKLLLKTTLHVYLHYKVAIRVLATFVQYFYTYSPPGYEYVLLALFTKHF